jgi:hypothetical protein
MRSRTPWAVKLRPGQKPMLVKNPNGPGRMLVPTPMLVAAEIRKVRRGSLVTPARLRARLARDAGAATTCPLTTGIFLNIIAGAAEEERAAGRRPTAPWWRVVDDNGRLNEKRPPGTQRQAQLLKAEGHRIARGRRPGEQLVVSARGIATPR